MPGSDAATAAAKVGSAWTAELEAWRPKATVYINGLRDSASGYVTTDHEGSSQLRQAWIDHQDPVDDAR